MVSFPPLIPSAGWWADCLLSWSHRPDFEEGIRYANSKLESPRDFGRFRLLDTNGNPITLSVAVEGGGRKLRQWASIEDISLSEHGDWRKIHLGAMEACLGKSPFYRDIEPLLSKVYIDMNLRSLKDFDSAIFESLFSFLMGNVKITDLAEFHTENNWLRRGEEVAESILPSISALEVISGIGREALMGFMALRNTGPQT